MSSLFGGIQILTLLPQEIPTKQGSILAKGSPP